MDNREYKPRPNLAKDASYSPEARERDASKWRLRCACSVMAGVRGTMESNPYETPPIDKSLIPTPQVVPSIWSIPIDVIGSWVPFGMVMLLFLPSLHELPKASFGRLVFELVVIVIAITIGTFVTLKRLVILAKRLTTGSCRTKASDA